jgi:hypothetical protein
MIEDEEDSAEDELPSDGGSTSRAPDGVRRCNSMYTESGLTSIENHGGIFRAGVDTEMEETVARILRPERVRMHGASDLSCYVPLGLLDSLSVADDAKGRVARKGDEAMPTYRRFFDFSKFVSYLTLCPFFFNHTPTYVHRSKAHNILSLDITCRDFRSFKLTFVVANAAGVRCATMGASLR